MYYTTKAPTLEIQSDLGAAEVEATTEGDVHHRNFSERDARDVLARRETDSVNYAPQDQKV